ncbi:hypothetical protein B0T24DRAFT_598424 [Lasiosphaeria ovina]|uniref:Protein kinase domain-containing protein n=1 Tax=Lasiosphaeria ovina TaxID=92902 RepID=A0AAE0JW42_9PEZI|nr:hypothetical protein B0T24DRAFT_598424 [Lasiosphaeria ovina]
MLESELVRRTPPFRCLTARWREPAAGWLHKGLRSDRIWFFRDLKSGSRHALPDITRPFITEFDFARPIAKESILHRQQFEPDIEYYYHSRTVQGYTKILDLYSLGIVMLEIGRWGIARKGMPEEHKKSDEAFHRYLVTHGAADMAWRVGGLYRDVVKTLLEGNLPDKDDEATAQGYFITVHFITVLEVFLFRELCTSNFAL